MPRLPYAPLAMYAQSPELIGAEAGGITSTLESDGFWHRILPGLVTGVSVYVATRLIDRLLFGGKR